MRRSTTIALAAAFALASSSATAETRDASWNLKDLHHRLSEPLRPRSPARSVADIATLREAWDAVRRTAADHYPIAVTVAWPAPVGHAQATEARSSNAAAPDRPPLASLRKLDPGQVTVSGVSSGGFFAHQFHVAFSGLVKGAGVIAGGPYGCAEQTPTLLSFNPMASVIVALGVCTRSNRAELDPFGLWLPDEPSASEAVELTLAEHAQGRIDDPANLAHDRVWLFSGDGDEVVPLSTVQALEAYYQEFGLSAPELHLERHGLATHGMPIEAFTSTTDHPLRACDEYGVPFLIDCDFDAAELLLRHLYPTGFVDLPASPEPSRLVAFDQAAFFDPADSRVSMAATGFLYIPADCLDDATSTEPCRLHVAFHGCQQHTDLIGDDFYWDAGYNRWAEANRIVVLYPQTTPWERPLDVTGFTANPKGCWDWWGYSGADYFRQSGKQMHAVRQMIDRLLPD